MKGYFRHCSVEELKQEIRSRLQGAWLRVDKMRENRTNESVDRKFYDYVSEIKAKQRQYDSLLNNPTELNSLLKKRRNRINESLQKYERSKSKTLTDFHSPHCDSQHPEFELTAHPDFYLTVHPLLQHHTLLQRASPLPPRSKTQANFFNRTLTEQEPSIKEKTQQVGRVSQEKDQEGRKLRSITKVINIAVNSAAKHTQDNNIFSFAKPPIDKNCKDPDMKATKKAIRFETAPNEPLTPASPTQKPLLQEHTSAMKQDCVKKIKDRMTKNYRQYQDKRLTTRELHQVFEGETAGRDELRTLMGSVPR